MEATGLTAGKGVLSRRLDAVAHALALAWLVDAAGALTYPLLREAANALVQAVCDGCARPIAIEALDVLEHRRRAAVYGWPVGVSDALVDLLAARAAMMFARVHTTADGVEVVEVQP